MFYYSSLLTGNKRFDHISAIEQLYENYIKQEMLLEALEMKLENIGILVKYGLEIEFYVPKNYDLILDSVESISNDSLDKNCDSKQNSETNIDAIANEKSANINIIESEKNGNSELLKIKKILGQGLNFDFDLKYERGERQFEISTSIYTSALSAISTGKKIRLELENLGFIIKPKPFVEDYGNSCQVNLSFFDKAINVYTGNDILRKIAARICKNSLQTLFMFLGNQDQLNRIDSRFMTPTHICYGFNNRTCLVRIPLEGDPRIEYRLGSNFSSLYCIFYFLLYCSYQALREIKTNSNSKSIHKNHDLNASHIVLNDMDKSFEVFGNAFNLGADLEIDIETDFKANLGVDLEVGLKTDLRSRSKIQRIAKIPTKLKPLKNCFDPKIIDLPKFLIYKFM